MDKQTLITKSGNWSDDNLTIPFEKGMDKQIRDMLLDSVEEALTVSYTHLTGKSVWLVP